MGNTKLADIYSDDLMEIRIPFLSGETELIPVGSTAVLTLADPGSRSKVPLRQLQTGKRLFPAAVW